jgi:hypothetical protein
MKRKRKTITPEMIRKYFGQNAGITRRLFGGFRVRTPRGVDIKISQSNINLVYGGSDVYRAAVLLSEEAWGGGKVKGPAEFKLAVLAHGEAEDVNMRVAEPGRWTRMIVPFLIAWFGISVSDSCLGGLVSLLVGGVVWLLMKLAAKRQAAHETQQMGFPFPRTAGSAKETPDEDLRTGRWL